MSTPTNNTLEFLLRLNVAAFQAGLNAAQQGLANLSGSANQSAQGAAQLGSALASAGQSGSQLASGVGQVAQATGALAGSAAQGAQSAAQLAAGAGQAAQATGALAGSAAQGAQSASQLAAGAGQAAQQTGELGSQAQQASTHVAGLGEQLGSLKGALAATLASAVLVGKAIHDSIDFSAAFSEVRKTVDGTATELNRIRGEVLGMAREIPLAATELAAIAAAGGQLGVSADQISRFTEVTAKMATAFDIAADQAGDSIGKLMNVFATDVAGVEQIGDAVNQLGNTTAARARDIVEVLLCIGGPARQMGLAADQAAALAATMLSLGKPAEVTGTALNALMQRLMTATDQGEDFQSALAMIGTSAEQLAADIRANPQQAINQFLQSLAKLDGQRLSSAMTGLFGMEHQANLSSLVTSLDVYGKAQAEIANQAAYAGSMQREFAIRTAETDKQIQLALNTLKEIGIQIGSVFLPAINKAMQALSSVAGTIADVAAQHPRLAALFSVVATGAAAFGPLRVAAGLAKTAMLAMAAQSLTAITGMVTKIQAAFTLLAAHPMLAAVTVALGAAVAVYQTVGKSALDMSRDHAQAAEEMGKSVAQANKQVATLKQLQQTLLTTKTGTDEHVAAEEELARVLPDANLKLDEQGRVLATVTERADENSKRLTALIELKEREARTQTALQVEQHAKAYYKAGEAVDDYAKNLKEWYGIGAETQDWANRFWLTLNRFSGTYDKNIAKGAEFRNNLAEQKNAFEQMLRTLAQSGTSVDQLSGMLSGIHLDEATKSRIVNDYSAMLDQMKRESQKANSDIAAGASAASKEELAARKKALDDMAAQYKRYAEQVRNLQDEIAGRERSLSAELRDMGRGGMSATSAWQDQKREAEEYVVAAKQAAAEAKAAFASGDTITASAKWKEAISYADQAKSSYRALNTEVREGDQVVVSKAQALETAMQGVKEAGELGIDLLKQQQQEIGQAMQDMEQQNGLDAMTAKMGEAEKKWLASWQKMGKAAEEAAQKAAEAQKIWINDKGYATNIANAISEGMRAATLSPADAARMVAALKKSGEEAARDVGNALDKAVAKVRTSTIEVRTVEKHQSGGLVGAFSGAFGGAIRAFAKGGKLPGYGGGDRISALLEAGEYIIKKEAVAHFGEPFFNALNNLRLPKLPVATLAGAASGLGRTVNINLNLAGETWPMQTDEATAEKIERWYALRSSNRITRNDYR